MLDARSPLASASPFSGANLALSEQPHFSLWQVAGHEKDVKKALGKVPTIVGVAIAHKGQAILRIAPQQYWLIDGEPPTESPTVFVTPLSSGRTRIVLEGSNARILLAKCAAIDFHPSAFLPGQFVMTGIHHTPALIHCVVENKFNIYVLRTFALSVWDYMSDAALEFAV